jgi:hypothetical protein
MCSCGDRADIFVETAELLQRSQSIYAKQIASSQMSEMASVLLPGQHTSARVTCAHHGSNEEG